VPTRWTSCLLAVLCTCVALSDTARADDPWEFWPEAQLFVGLNPRTRVFLDAAYAKGKESDEASLDTAGYLDISLLPVGPRRRRLLRTEDWQRGWRLEATRELVVLDHAVVPYLNVEWFYDTRYDGWTRTLYQGGTEVTLNRHLRFELNLSQQTDTLPSRSRLNAFGVVAKGYF